MSLDRYIRESLRGRVLGDEDVLAEAKSVGDWWDRLPGKRRTKVVSILGMSKGKDKKIFAKLDADEQAEISAYYKKHKGKVEGVNVEFDPLEEQRSQVPQYKSLNDAAKRVNNPLYRKGRTEIWYMTRKGWKQFSMGGHKGDVYPPVSDIGKLGTHKLLGSIAATKKEQIFVLMQGEEWSPEGEARTMIPKKGLVHTSMSVGDIVKIGNKAWMVDIVGFKELGTGKKEGTEQHGDALVETSQEQWEMAADVLDKGIAHPLFRGIKGSYEEFIEALKEGKTRNDRMKKIGVGRTEAPTFLLLANKELKKLASNAKSVSDAIERKMR